MWLGLINSVLLWAIDEVGTISVKIPLVFKFVVGILVWKLYLTISSFLRILLLFNITVLECFGTTKP